MVFYRQGIFYKTEEIPILPSRNFPPTASSMNFPAKGKVHDFPSSGTGNPQAERRMAKRTPQQEAKISGCPILFPLHDRPLSGRDSCANRGLLFLSV
ncbi:hypothetical protein [Allobaculum sp. Allo2]|uniref:hypothetical protein n=1 Tax=Allobaculum sp. Allo2 TaxID=2853432 RepID=UPI001F60E586|nr:hypothetical protein [Allobaculum sp. Allo2]UNT93747.1 hypothetical protein KWG61_03145 [Allobaculum sp. Allo2]